MSATKRQALAAANAAKQVAMTHPWRPSAYWLIMFLDGLISGLRTCSAANAMSAAAATPRTARAATREYVIKPSAMPVECRSVRRMSVHRLESSYPHASLTRCEDASKGVILRSHEDDT